MSFAVDHFIQVKCKFQLTSETESSDSSQMNWYSEKIRLCTSAELQDHMLIVMVCSNETSNNHIVAYYTEKNTRSIVKQIYYHNYNEDIVAISLTKSGNKLALINASSTIYIIPIRNILLDSHHQRKHMYLYDASIIDCCDIDYPITIVFRESKEVPDKSTIIVGGSHGEISFISVEEKRVISSSTEAIGNMIFPKKSRPFPKLDSLDPDEVINHYIITERFLAVTTDKDRCLINSRNVHNLRRSNSAIGLDSLVKEIVFYNDEKILLLLKSPHSNDEDGIIDSFLVVTSRSIYSVEARQSCRDMFINLIDENLGFKLSPLLDISENNFKYNRFNLRRSSVNLMVNNFLIHRDEVYETIVYDSTAFSTLFKVELGNLYEAYGDRLLLRGQFLLANRFFQMANFNQEKIFGKYAKLGSTVAMHSFQLVKLASNDHRLSKLVTSPQVTQPLTKDLSFTSETMCCHQQKKLLERESHSSASSSQLNSYRKLILSYRQDILNFQTEEGINLKLFTREQKQCINNIFIGFLNVCLNQSIQECCKVWFYYINFYLHHIGSVEKLEAEILSLLTKTRDSRLGITLFIALEKETSFKDKLEETVLNDIESNLDGDELMFEDPLDTMKNLHKLRETFKNHFLMRLLGKTLELIPKQHNYNGFGTIAECLGVDCSTSGANVPSRDSAWPQILKVLVTSTGNQS